MRNVTMLIAAILGLVLATSPVLAHQTPPADVADADIEAIAEATLGADLDALIAGLQEPIPDEDLPESFSSAEYVAPDEVGEEDLVLPMEDVAFAEDSVGFNVDYDPPVDGFAIGLASLNYILVDGEITERDLQDFKEGASQGTGTEDVMARDIEINGVRGVLISVELEEEGIISVVQMIALPVGNTMVLSMAVVASDDPSLDTGAVRTDAESLLLAGVVRLGEVAERAQ